MGNHAESPFSVLKTHSEWLDMYRETRPPVKAKECEAWLNNVCEKDKTLAFDYAHRTRPHGVYVASAEDECGDECIIAYFATPHTWYSTKIRSL